jgi:hypothetical protein
MNPALVAIGAFIVIVAMLVLLRNKTGNKLEIKNSDIVLALVPVALWLFLTGKIQEFTFGDLKIVAAIKAASNSPVASQVSELSKLPVENLEMAAKGGVDLIPQLIEKKSEALIFRTGHGGYYGPAIQKYYQDLSQYPYFRYTIINNNDGSFFGIADGRQMAADFKDLDGMEKANRFAYWLNGSNTSELERLPGFISRQQALNKTSDKRHALRLMDSLDVQTLPVIDESGRFAGMVDRAKLSASMLIDIADKLESAK